MPLFTKENTKLETPSAAFKMISAEDAWTIVCDTASRVAPRTELVSLHVAQGHVIGEDILAKDPVPAYRASIKDGFAVRASDGRGKYPIVYECHAGVDVDAFPELRAGHVAYIRTGGPLPEGADAVVQVEDTKMTGDVVDVVGVVGGKHSVVEILKDAVEGEDVREIGSDMKPGELVLRKGELIGAAEVAMLATVGVTQVCCMLLYAIVCYVACYCITHVYIYYSYSLCTITCRCGCIGSQKWPSCRPETKWKNPP